MLPTYLGLLTVLISVHLFINTKCPNLCADDTQIYGRCSPPAVDDLQERLSTCIDDVHACSPVGFSWIALSQSCSGMSQPAGSISYQGLHLRLDPTLSFRRRLYVTSASSLTPTSAHRNMFSRSSPAAVVRDSSHRPSTRIWSLHLFFVGWVT